MVCIYCGGQTAVKNSRAQKRLNRTWRRRHCLHCQATFTSIEAAALGESISVTNDTPRPRAFQADKLFLSIYRSCGHRSSAVSDSRAICDTVTAKALRELKGGKLERHTLRAITSEVLHKFDMVAALHYDAYHAANKI